MFDIIKQNKNTLQKTQIGSYFPKHSYLKCGMQNTGILFKRFILKYLIFSVNSKSVVHGPKSQTTYFQIHVICGIKKCLLSI